MLHAINLKKKKKICSYLATVESFDSTVIIAMTTSSMSILTVLIAYLMEQNIAVEQKQHTVVLSVRWGPGHTTQNT